ncbi:MAG: endolytic transglycosylase MltG [Chthonomonadaceae bacterium]|nr:endolytic transglycosylase MltG [Chthonomonadaceae bacterium]
MTRDLMTSETKSKKKNQKKPILPLLIAGAGVLGVGGLYGSSLFKAAGQGIEKSVVIPKGAGATTVSHILERDKIIKSAFAFRTFLKFGGGGEKFKPGRYTLKDDLTLSEIAERLNSGPKAEEQLVRVTIPEGYTLKQIAEVMERKKICTAQDFLYLTQDAKGISQLRSEFPLPKETLEGFLFPDTYEFDRKTTANQVVEAMLTNFAARFTRPYLQEIAGRGKTLNEIVTIASLIEREAKVSEDRSRIAGVIENRIAKNMKLEIDATVLYALGKHKNRVLFADLRVESPYNTYRVKGLPPGAIANPGLACLLAALRPEKNEFVYYVARPNGAHLFTRTLAEHEQAKKQARKERRATA